MKTSWLAWLGAPGLAGDESPMVSRGWKLQGWQGMIGPAEV